MRLLEWKPPASPQRLLRPFGYWNAFNGLNQTVTAQLEKVDDGGHIRLNVPSFRGRVRYRGSDRERWKDRNRKMTGWSGGSSNVFSASPLSPGDHLMLSCLSFKRGRLCQSSQIRKTEVAERLYLAWVQRRGAPWEVRRGEGQLSHFVSQVGAFHAAPESWRGGPTKTGSEWRSTGFASLG